MMQKMVAIEAKEDARAFNMPLFRQVHAPVHVFVSGEIQRTSHGRTTQDTPLMREKIRPNQKWHLTDGDNYRTVPPRHRDGFLVRLMDEMIGVVGLENMMMHQGMAFETDSERISRTRTCKHEITMQGSTLNIEAKIVPETTPTAHQNRNMVITILVYF